MPLSEHWQTTVLAGPQHGRGMETGSTNVKHVALTSLRLDLRDQRSQAHKRASSGKPAQARSAPR